MPPGQSKYSPFVVRPFPYPVSCIDDLKAESIINSKPAKNIEHPIHLALKWKDDLRKNNLLTMTKMAVKHGCSRARVTQIMNLLKLDKNIQELLQKLSDPRDILFFSERRLRRLSSIPNKKFQIAAFSKLVSQMKSSK